MKRWEKATLDILGGSRTKPESKPKPAAKATKSDDTLSVKKAANALSEALRGG